MIIITSQNTNGVPSETAGPSTPPEQLQTGMETSFA